MSAALVAGVPPQAWEVKDLNGAPGLYRDGAPVAPLFFWQWELQEPDVREMSRRGFDLFAMFGSFPHYRHPYWRVDGSFDTAYYDAQFDAALRWNPSAQLLPRLFVTAPDWWSELNTNEQFVAEVPSGVKVSWEHLPRESFASVKAREEVAPYYRRLVRHLIDKYGRNLLGVHVTNGPWGEDFSWDAYFLQKFRPAAGDQSEPMRRAFVQYLRGKYGNDVSRLRAAFKDPAATFETVKVPTKAERLRVNADGWRDPAEGRKVVDYFECHNRVTVDMLDYWCSLVKEESGGKLATLVFYGYTQDERWPVECDHRAISELYLRPSVDMLSAPHTYHRRDLGGDGEMRQYLASAALHGKLFVDEGDDMSHLERLKPRPDRRARFREPLRRVFARRRVEGGPPARDLPPERRAHLYRFGRGSLVQQVLAHAPHGARCRLHGAPAPESLPHPGGDHGDAGRGKHGYVHLAPPRPQHGGVPARAAQFFGG